MPVCSGSAQWIVWSIVRYWRSTGSVGRLFTYLTLIAVPCLASTVTPGHDGAGPAELVEGTAPVA